MDFNLVRLRFTVRLEDDCRDPYALYGIRSDFVTHFQRTVCVADALCHTCNDRSQCPYPANFAQDLAVDPYALKRHQKPALPFAFDPPLLPSLPNKGESFEIVLSIFGTAINHVAHYVEAARRLFQSPLTPGSVRGTVEGVESLDWQGNAIPLPIRNPSGAMMIVRGDDIVSMFSCSARLVLRTPLQLLRDGRPMKYLEPSHLLRSIVRRVSSMVYYYGGDEMEADYELLAQASREAALVDAAIAWEEWGGGRVAGLVGEATLTGLVDEFRPFLALGGLMHLGKGAAFGMGRFAFA